jgi:hypothetical protein
MSAMQAVLPSLAARARSVRKRTLSGADLKIVAIWLWVRGGGAVLLHLRYDWTVGGGFFAKRAYSCRCTSPS